MTDNLPARQKRRISQTRKSVKLEKAVAMRSRGATWAEVAEEVGASSAKQISDEVSRYLARLAKSSEASIDSYRQEMLAQLEQMEKECWAVIEKEHVAHSGGKVVQMVDQEGEIYTLKDDGPAMNAIDRLLKIMERKAKLTGVDMSPEVGVGIAVHHTVNGVNLEDLR